MKFSKLRLAAVAAVALLGFSASPASARTIPLSTLPLDTTSTFTIGVNAKGSFLDDLTFTTPSQMVLLVSAVTDDEHHPFLSMQQGVDKTDTGLDIELFKGTVTGPHSLVETDITDTGNAQTQDLATIILNPGAYYFQVSGKTLGSGTLLLPSQVYNGWGGEIVTIVKGKPKYSNPAYGEYTLNATVSSIPEPATWAMMLMGFGFVGFRLRSSSKRTAIANA